MIRKNWAHSHNFRDIVEHVADCGAKKYPHIYHRNIKTQGKTTPETSFIKLNGFI